MHDLELIPGEIAISWHLRHQKTCLYVMHDLYVSEIVYKWSFYTTLFYCPEKIDDENVFKEYHDGKFMVLLWVVFYDHACSLM